MIPAFKMQTKLLTAGGVHSAVSVSSCAFRHPDLEWAAQISGALHPTCLALLSKEYHLSLVVAYVQYGMQEGIMNVFQLWDQLFSMNPRSVHQA